LGKDKIVVLGHSWGTVVGMHLVKRHPEWISAYVGVGQVVNSMENERVVYRHLWELAEAKGDTTVLTQMRSMAPYPNPEDPVASFIENGGGRYLRAQANRLGGDAVSRYVPIADSAKIISFSKFSSPLLTWQDAFNDRYGDKIPQFYKTYPLLSEVLREDLPHQLGNKFDVPIFFFTGSHDWHVARSLTEGWFNQIQAPQKELVWFEESAHAVPTDEPGKFLVALVTKVLPVAQAQRAGSAPTAAPR
jgi:pimeloyl-ACP methyl ester carboxylesterase